MKIKFYEPWHIRYKEYLAKHKKYALRLVTRWNRLGQPAFFILRVKGSTKRRGVLWHDFTYSKPPHKRVVTFEIHESGAKQRIVELTFEVIR